MIRKLAMVAVIAFVTEGFVSGQTHSAVKIVTVDAFEVIGTTCRTNNANETSGKGCIGQQWEHLMSEGLLQKIPGRTDNNIVAVYTDYASDKDSNYTYILGAKVKPSRTAPSGMVKTTVKAGRFAVFTSDKGPVQQVVPANWKRIWELPKAQPGGDRLYQSDFELYDERAADPKSAEMDIFIRVR
jgi:predicted transcriptional regulator YdeE